MNIIRKKKKMSYCAQIVESKENRKQYIVESKESGNKEIPWFNHEDLHPHAKALDSYIFTI